MALSRLAWAHLNAVGAVRLKELTKDGPAWYASTRARVEARAALEQAEELLRVLRELGREVDG